MVKPISLVKVKYGFSVNFNRRIGKYRMYWTRSICICWYWSWITKPRNWLSFRTNKAVKGVDSCFDCTLCIFLMAISYTNWDYSETSQPRKRKELE